MLLLDDAPIYELYMVLPEQGPWRAHVKCNYTPSKNDGIVNIQDTSIVKSYSGYLKSSGTIAGEFQALVVAGNGNLQTEISSKNYKSATAKKVFQDICTDSDLTLSTYSDPTALSTSLGFWTRVKSNVSDTLTELCEKIGATWIINSNGEVQILQENYSFEVSKEVQGDYLVIDRDFTQETLTLSISGFWLIPGMEIDGYRVNRVVYTQEKSLKAVAYV